MIKINKLTLFSNEEMRCARVLLLLLSLCVPAALRVPALSCVCGRVYVVYEDTHLYNDMGMAGITRRR